jgi:hypothetical protein
VQRIKAGPDGQGGDFGLDELLASYRDDLCSNSIVMLLRLITSAEIQSREAHFLPFVVVRGPQGIASGLGGSRIWWCAGAGGPPVVWGVLGGGVKDVLGECQWVGGFRG